MYGQPARSSEFPPNHSRIPTRRDMAPARAETLRADRLTWLGYFSLLASIILAALAVHGFPTR
jgi:hypothetical protein